MLLLHNDSNTIVFCHTRESVKHLTARLANRGFPVVALSGELTQAERSNALQAMRDGRARVCVATDVEARGIDQPKLDLVIHDRHFSPFWFNQDGALYIPAESVYAVFEVKQGLEKETVQDAGKKAASVRNLHRTSAPVPWAGGTTKPREPQNQRTGSAVSPPRRNHWRSAA